MESSGLPSYPHSHRWANALSAVIVILLMIIAGYTVGRDMALRDNARDAKVAQGAGQ